MVWAAGPYCLRPVQDNPRLVENLNSGMKAQKANLV